LDRYTQFHGKADVSESLWNSYISDPFSTSKIYGGGDNICSCCGTRIEQGDTARPSCHEFGY
jgi:hypothetical protein